MAVIHVNRAFIAMNAKDGGNRPVYTIKLTPNGRALYAHQVIIHGTSRMVYNGSQLNCGARAWIECKAKDIEPVGGYVSFKEAQNAA